ncbi:MAG: tyrosine/phenylalanine carboxypeptidase domain-containing protein [Candidatus Paceibacteria bacterium]
MESFNSNNNENVLDERWFNSFKEFYFEDYEKLDGSKDKRAKAKESFLSGEIRNPVLDYPKLETFDLEGYEKGLLQLKSELLEEEDNETIQKIYRTKINEMVATVRMLKACRDADDKKFSKYSEFIHGKPSVNNTAYAFDAVQHGFATSSPKTEQQESDQKKFLELIEGYEFGLVVGGEQANRDDLPEVTDGSELVQNQEEAVQIIKEALSDLAVDDWTVVVNEKSGASNFSVAQEFKEVRVPSTDNLTKRKISKNDLAGLVAHEINTHVARRVNGERSKLMLLGFGLDRYVKGEEGVATYQEQQVTGAKEFAGVPYYLATAFAKGFDGTPRDFRDTFEVMKLYYSGKGMADPDTTAWNTCVRIFRGTTGSTPGAVFTKDLAYLAGNREVWTLVNNDEDVVQQFSVGKYDPSREDHVAYLIQLGITEKDLDAVSEE